MTVIVTLARRDDLFSRNLAPHPGYIALNDSHSLKELDIQKSIPERLTILKTKYILEFDWNYGHETGEFETENEAYEAFDVISKRYSTFKFTNVTLKTVNFNEINDNIKNIL